MPMRTIIIHGVTFQIDQEIDYRLTGAATALEINDDLSYITTGVSGTNIDCWNFQSQSIKFSGVVTPINGDPAEIAKWRLGFGQNVVIDGITATYGQNYLIQQAMQVGVPPWQPPIPPIRDGEPGELPFSYDEADLVLNEPSTVKSSDEPSFTTPAEIAGGTSTLAAVAGTVGLSTWLMLARVEAPREILLLGRIDWAVNFVWAAGGAGPILTVQRVVPNLQDIYTNAQPPLLGNGRVAPDLRVDASGNTYRMGTLSQAGGFIRSWSFADEGQAIALNTNLPNPNVYPNWLSNPPQ